MSIPHALLGLLESGPQHGYTLKHDYDHKLAQGRPLRFGQVYATLARLERDGLATVVAVEAGEGPERRSYALTSTGVAEFEKWLMTPELPDPRAVGALFVKTVLALESGRDPHDVLEAQQQVHIARMRELRRTSEDGDDTGRMAADYEIAHLEADLAWIERTTRRLASSGDGSTR